MRHAITWTLVLASLMTLPTKITTAARPQLQGAAAPLFIRTLVPVASMIRWSPVPAQREADVAAAETLYQLGIISYEANKDAQAITYFDRALRAADAYPDRYNTYLYRGLSHYALRHYVLAQADFARCIAIRPRAADAYFDRGNADKDAGLYPLAVTDYTSYLRLAPANDDKWAAYENRGNCYLLLGGERNLHLAIADFTMSTRLNARRGKTYGDRGAAYENLGAYDAALADDTTAIHLGFIYAYFQRGNVHFKRGLAHNLRPEYQAAIDDYSMYLHLSPRGRKAWTVHSNRGSVYDVLGMYTRAIQDFDQALQLDPTYADAYFGRSHSEYELGDRSRAVADMRHALALYIAQHNATGAQQARAALHYFGA